MSIIPSPAALRAKAGRGVTAVARKVLRVQLVADGELTHVPDDLPRNMLFAQPLMAKATVVGAPERDVDGQVTVTFRVLVKDANGKRCSDIHVEAEVAGPERTAVGETTTDMMGACTFKMSGPVGTYAIHVTGVAALALDWDVDGSTTRVAVDVL